MGARATVALPQRLLARQVLQVLADREEKYSLAEICGIRGLVCNCNFDGASRRRELYPPAKIRFVITRKHPSLSKHTTCAKQFQWFARPRQSDQNVVEHALQSKEARNVRRPDQGSSVPQMRSNDVTADHRAGKPWFRFANFRMPEML